MHALESLIWQWLLLGGELILLLVEKLRHGVWVIEVEAMCLRGGGSIEARGDGGPSRTIEGGDDLTAEEACGPGDEGAGGFCRG